MFFMTENVKIVSVIYLPSILVPNFRENLWFFWKILTFFDLNWYFGFIWGERQKIYTDTALCLLFLCSSDSDADRSVFPHTFFWRTHEYFHNRKRDNFVLNFSFCCCWLGKIKRKRRKYMYVHWAKFSISLDFCHITSSTSSVRSCRSEKF